MLGALGTFNFIYEPSFQLSISNLVNSFVRNNLKDASGFVKDLAPAAAAAVPNYAARVADRDAFYKRLDRRFNLDASALQNAYLVNAQVNRNGTESAHGVNPRGALITMLNVEPIATPPAPEPDPDNPGAVKSLPATNYADNLTPQSTDPGALPAAGTLGSAMSKLFWRGNIERTCRTSLANGAQEMLALRDSCMAGAAGGGRPDACTACVELAELHIPRADLTSPLNPVLDSKCSLLGTESTSSPPTAFPSWWYDNYYRLNGITQSDAELPPRAGLALPGFYVAMTWCTGAEIRDSAEVDEGFGVTPGSDFSSTGVLQRQTTWNRDCGIAESQGTYFYTVPQNEPRSITGEWVGTASNIYGTDCELVQAREFVSTCPDGLTCNAGGECAPTGTPPPVRLVSTPISG